MTSAIHTRQFGFRASAMQSSESADFRRLVKAVGGMTSSEPSSLLSSLACELCFNDQRDAGRRHSKNERVTPSNLHCISYKSSLVRTAGCKTLPIQDADWAQPLSSKAVKKTVWSSLRASDISLGVSSEGLTRHRSNAAFTKPHVFCNRLRLLKLLCDFWHSHVGTSEQKRAKVVGAYKTMWLSRLVPQQAFLRFKVSEDNEPDCPVLVARSGPHSILCLHMDKVEGLNAYSFGEWSAPRDEILILDHANVEVCLTKPVIAEKGWFGDNFLAWEESGSWMSLLDFVADVSISTITAQLLTSLCSRLKIHGHSKLQHRLKVELFLRWMGRSEEYVAQVLAQIPEKPPRKPKTTDDPQEDRGLMFLLSFPTIEHS